MKNISKKIVFFGNERLVSGLSNTTTPILKALIKVGYSVVAVVSHHSDSSSRNKRSLEVADVAQKYGIQVLLPNKPSDIHNELVALQADAAVLVAYGRIIPQSIIDIFPSGIINIHPSLLPKYRGPTPIESAIVSGDLKTGVSIMQLTAGMDEGPVYAQTAVTIDRTDTKFDLYEKLINVATPLLMDILPSILDGTLKPEPQDNSLATYCQLLTKADGALQLDKLSAKEAEHKIRAYLGFPKTKLTMLGYDTTITKAHVSANKETSLDILCADGQYLSIDELVAPSGRKMSAKDFINGYSATGVA